QVTTFSADGTKLAVGSADGHVTLWDVATGRSIGSPLDVGGGTVYGVFDPTDATRLYTAATDGSVARWDLNAEPGHQRVALFHTPPVTPHGFGPESTNPLVLRTSADGTRLLAGDPGAPPDPTTYVWDVSRARLLQIPGRPGSLSADGSTVVTTT